MERKITHYVVKPEHLEHADRLIGHVMHDDGVIHPETVAYNVLVAAKVLDLWCTPVCEKPRVKGWYGVSKNKFLAGPYTHPENIPPINSEIGVIHIDQEIE